VAEPTPRPHALTRIRMQPVMVRDVTGVDVRELGGELPEHLGDWLP